MKKVSDILRETREERDLTLEDIESATKIKKEYLAAIEDGKFNRLPSESYALGYVKNYAKFLGIQASRAVPLFRREYKTRHTLHIVPEFRKTQHRFNKQLFLSGKALLIGIAVLIISVYVFFQYSSLLFPPKLEITSPKNGQTLSGSVVEVTGKTDPYATVTVEGEETYVTIQGTFRKSVYTFSGENEIEIISKNRFGKETKKTVIVKIK
jgi:cytoskeletal protein RodZ